MRAIPYAAVEFIKKHEALRLKTYLDSGGVPTNGWGHTGPDVKMGQTITREKAEQQLADDLADARRKLYGVVKAPVLDTELTDHQYGALISFVFNLGAKKSWTIWKALNAKNFDAVPVQMMRFVYDQDPATKKMRKVPGLVNRRAEEVKFWSIDEPGTEDVKLTSAALRGSVTPPAALDPVPAKKSTTFWGAVFAPFLPLWVAVEGFIEQAPDFIKSALSAVNPFADKSPVAEAVQTGLASLGAVVGVYVAVSIWRKKKDQGA